MITGRIIARIIEERGWKLFANKRGEGKFSRNARRRRAVNYRRTLKNPSVARARRYRWVASP